jgi:hypothetical protein
MKTYGGVEAHTFLTSVLNRMSDKLHAPNALPRGKIPLYPFDSTLSRSAPWRRNKSPLAGDRTSIRILACSLVTLLFSSIYLWLYSPLLGLAAF